MSRLSLFCFLILVALCNAQSAIDMTHVVSEEDTLVWPGGTKFNHTEIYHGEYVMEDGSSYYVESNQFAQTEHLGTHLDAPAHFNRGSWRVHEIPFKRLMGEACVVDIENRAATDYDAMLMVSDLEAWEETNGQIPDSAIVLMYSGNGKYFGNRTRYFGFPPGVNGDSREDVIHIHFPGLHPEAAEWLVKNRNIYGIGVDTPSTDYGQAPDFPVHQIMAKANIYNLENLANVDKLPARGYMIYAMVHKIKNGSGGPARVFAQPMQSAGSGMPQSKVILTSLTSIVLLCLSNKR